MLSEVASVAWFVMAADSCHLADVAIAVAVSALDGFVSNKNQQYEDPTEEWVTTLLDLDVEFIPYVLKSCLGLRV